MKHARLFALLLALILLFTACASGTEPEHEATASAPVAVPVDKTESHTLTGTWTSEDGQTVVPITLHLYDDGSAVLESHENTAGSWSESDGALSIELGEDSYLAEYSEADMGYRFTLSGKLGDEDISVRLKEIPDPAKIAERNNQALIDRIASQGFEAEGEPGEIIFYGGSNFQKWNTLEEDLAGYPVRNNSIGGSNDPIRRHFAAERVYDLKPAAVFYMSSSNDWTSGQTAEEITSYKQELFDEFSDRLPETVFVILSATPNPLRYYGEYHDGMVEVDGWTAAYCEGQDRFEFLDVVPALSLEDGAEPNPELWQSDNLHLNAEGYAILTELVRAKLDEIADTYGLTYAAAESEPEDGEAERAFWSRDWESFDGWLTEDFAEKEISYQLTGSWSMEGDYPMAFHLLLNLYADGSARVWQHSPTRGDNSYFGYWTLRETEKGRRISLTMVSETDGDSLVEHSYSYKLYTDSEGRCSFSYDFGIIPGAYMRAADISGGEQIKYAADADFAEAMDNQ